MRWTMAMRSMDIRKVCVEDAMKNRCVIMIRRNMGMPDPRMNVDKRQAHPQRQPEHDEKALYVFASLDSRHVLYSSAQRNEYSFYYTRIVSIQCKSIGEKWGQIYFLSITVLAP